MIANGKTRRERIALLRKEIKKIEKYLSATSIGDNPFNPYHGQLKRELFSLTELERVARGKWGRA